MRLRKRPDSGATTAALIQPAKRQVIDFAMERIGVRRFADLGGVWAVDAAYTFYGLSRPGVERAVLIDTSITAAVRDRAESEPRLSLIESDFSTPEAAESVGPVDAVLMFDVLLHQVDPDWDDVLTTWAAQTRSFIIVNPQLGRGDKPVRLLDLGPEGYAANTPRDHLPVPWDALDEIDPRYGKPRRDIHEYWQWGITDTALHNVLSDLGYRPLMYVNHGQWRDVPTFDNVAFVYAAS